MIFVGTSGFSYKEWLGSFYPPKISQSEMLPFYAEQFLSTEINNTFYRMPDESVLKSWSEHVGKGFLFAVKARKLITSGKGREYTRPNGYLYTFLTRLTSLGGGLGAVLFLFSPGSGSLYEVNRLMEAVHSWRPGGLPFQPVVEVRQPPDDREAIRRGLEAGGWILCHNDQFAVENDLKQDAGQHYIRLRNGPYQEETLEQMARWIHKRCNKAKNSYVYFRHAPDAPYQAARFRTIMESL